MPLKETAQRGFYEILFSGAEGEAMTRTPLRRKTPMRRGGKLAAASPKRRRDLIEYAKLRKTFLEVHTHCQFPNCEKRATQVHHSKRRGKHLLDVCSFRAVCFECHRWIETHARQAEAMGLLVRENEKH